MIERMFSKWTVLVAGTLAALLVVVWWFAGAREVTPMATQAGGEPTSGANRQDLAPVPSGSLLREAPIRQEALLGTPDSREETPASSGQEPVGTGRSGLSVELVRCLSTFHGEEPDIQAWNGLLTMLADDVVLDPASIRRSGQEATGRFSLPGMELGVAFVVGPDGYRVEFEGPAALLGAEAVDLNAALAFEAKDGVITGLHGSVQLATEDDQRFALGGPLGYVYGVADDQVRRRRVGGEVREDGAFYVTIPGPEHATLAGAGDLACAHAWLARLDGALEEHGRKPR